MRVLTPLFLLALATERSDAVDRWSHRDTVGQSSGWRARMIRCWAVGCGSTSTWLRPRKWPDRTALSCYGPTGKERTTRFGLPVIVVLDKDGKQLTTQDTAKLEEGDHPDPKKVLAFLNQWKPKTAAKR